MIRTVGEDHEPRRFSTWAPVAIAAIGRIADTLEDRSVRIELKRRALGETVERWRVDRAHLLGDVVRRCVRWAADHLDDLRQADPGVPDQLHDRAADNWRPLLAIADAAGGEWPERAREAAVELSPGGDADTRRIMLLADIKAIFAERSNPDWIATAFLISGVGRDDRAAMEHDPARRQADHGARPASLLEPFKVFSSHNDTKTTRGYRLNRLRRCMGALFAARRPFEGESIRPSVQNLVTARLPARIDIRPEKDSPDGCAFGRKPARRLRSGRMDGSNTQRGRRGEEHSDSEIRI